MCVVHLDGDLRRQHLDLLVLLAEAAHDVTHGAGNQEIFLHQAQLLEHSGANSFLHVVAAAGFQHHRFDSLEMQKMGQHQSRGTCSDNSDLCAHSDGKELEMVARLDAIRLVSNRSSVSSRRHPR